MPGRGREAQGRDKATIDILESEIAADRNRDIAGNRKAKARAGC